MKLYAFLALVCIGITASAQTRYWVSGTPAVWSSNNWSSTSGGAADGGGPPTAGQFAEFDGNGLGNCTVDVAAAFDGIDVNAAYSGDIDINGQVFTISGANNCSFVGGSISDGTGTSSLSINTTGRTDFDGTVFNVDVNAVSGRLFLDGSTFNNASIFEKNGANNDGSIGGNTFATDVAFTNSGSGYILLGNGNPDVFSGNVVLSNTGTSNIYIADNAAGNTIAGDLDITNSGVSVFVARQAGSTLTIGGNLTLDQTSAQDCNSYVGNNGSVDITGNLSFTNTATADVSQMYCANGAAGSVNVGGTTDFINSGTGATTHRIWVGENGTIVFNDDVTFTANSAANNSQIFVNRQAGSSSTFNENIIVNSSIAGSDGVLFGSNGGSITLAATKTITVGVGGFIDGTLEMENFTQTGATPQSLTLTSDARMVITDSDWGGNVVFVSPRITSNGTTYNGTASLEKTGANNDNSGGGNTFIGAVTLTNSGSGQFGMGNGTADLFQNGLDVINSGSSNLHIALDGVGHTVTGDMTVSLSGSAVSTILANTLASSLVISGNLDVTNTSTSNASSVYIGNTGDVTIGGDLTIDQSPTIGTNSNIYVADDDGSVVTIAGATDVDNNGATTNQSRIFLANQGDITFTGDLAITNNSSSTNNQVYCNHGANSANAYNGNIVVESTDADADGIFFGQNAGLGTLALTRTITVGGGGYIAGLLHFENFSQLGPTPQNLTTTGTSFIRIQDSDWGGDVDFSGSRITTTNTLYSGTSSLEKTGDTADDQSAGGNTFVGDCILTNNSTTNYMMMGNGSPDDWQGNLTLENSGGDHLYIANNSAGNNIDGNLVINATGSSQLNSVSNNAASTIQIDGNLDINMNSNGNSRTFIGDDGDVNIDGVVTIDNSGTGAGSYVEFAQGADSEVIIAGTTTLTNDNTATTNGYAYFGVNGDMTFNDVLTIDNSSTATNSSVRCNSNAASVNTYNQNIVVTNSNAASDGVFFGIGGGAGTLAATRTITTGAAGFITGELRFRNFTQVGPTAQAITLTGDALMQHYDSDWGGDVTFIAPRMNTRGTLYNGTSYLEKTGATNDQSIGGNTFVGDCELRHTGSNQFLMGNGNPDIWQSNLVVNNIGSGYMYIAHNSAGNQINGTLDWANGGACIDGYIANANGSDITIDGDADFQLTSSFAGNSRVYAGNQGNIDFNSNVNVDNNGTGTTSEFRMANNVNSIVTIDGTLDFDQFGTATTSRAYFATNGQLTCNGVCTFINQGAGTTSETNIGNGADASITFNDAVVLTNNGNITTTRSYLGNNGDIVFNGQLDIINNSTSNNSDVYLNHGANSSNSYNANIIVASTAAGCDGVRFGQNGGSGTLAATLTVSIGAGGFVDGDLRFRNFTQLSATAQNITTTGTSRIYSYDSEWNGDVDFEAPQLLTQGTTYNGTALLHKNGAGNNYSVGGNIFNDDMTLENSGTGQVRFSNNAGFPDDYNGNATFIKSGTGVLRPAYNNDDTFAGDINIDANAQITFGNGNGRVVFDAAGAQAINDVGASPEPFFERIRTSNTADEITLNTSVTVTVELDLEDGNINSSVANLLTMNDNSTVDDVSDDAFVDGPMDKVGNDPFVFPVGDQGRYNPIEISNPASGAAQFRAEYFFTDPAPFYDDTQLDPTIDHISDCEYWTLDRLNTTNDVVVTLHYKGPSPGCSGVDPAGQGDLVVARWDGAIWRDHGNGGTTGTSTGGSVSSSGNVTSFSPFTLATITNINPLPIELLSFDASLNDDNTVRLSWSTASEINNEMFVVERSQDGQNFEAILWQDGAGNSSQTLYYSDVDNSPITGANYYRLKQIDFDGAYSYSDVRIVEVIGGADITIYPNPSTGPINITLNEADDAKVDLYDLNGKLLSNHRIVKGANELDFNLPSGVYLVHITINGNRQVQKLTIK